MLVKSEILYDFPRFFGVLVAELTATGMVNLTFKMNRDMIIENLDLEPKINAIERDFLDPSRWKELSKETGSKILPSGDGSCRKTFNPIASLIGEDDRECVCMCEIQIVVRKKVNSRYVVKNVLIGCRGAYVRNEGDKRYNKYKESAS
ncbi:hypothetical protein Tco_1030190, partial [Tanacetum coccineum]